MRKDAVFPENASVHNRYERPSLFRTEQKMRKHVLPGNRRQRDIIRRGYIGGGTLRKAAALWKKRTQSFPASLKEHPARSKRRFFPAEAEKDVGSEALDHVARHSVRPENIVGDRIPVHTAHAVIRVRFRIRYDEGADRANKVSVTR